MEEYAVFLTVAEMNAILRCINAYLTLNLANERERKILNKVTDKIVEVQVLKYVPSEKAKAKLREIIEEIKREVKKNK